MNKPVPEKAIVGSLPHRKAGVALRLTLEAVGQVQGVGEIHRPGSKQLLQHCQVRVFVMVVQWALAERKKFSTCDFVDHVAAQPSHRLSFGDDNNVLVY